MHNIRRNENEFQIFDISETLIFGILLFIIYKIKFGVFNFPILLFSIAAKAICDIILFILIKIIRKINKKKG